MKIHKAYNFFMWKFFIASMVMVFLGAYLLAATNTGEKTTALIFLAAIVQFVLFFILLISKQKHHNHQ